MKPTIQQVVAHFGLPDEAAESERLQKAIDSSVFEVFIDKNPEYVMNGVAWSFGYLNKCNIIDWFKPK